MDAFSPLTRRIVAIGLVVFVALLSVNLIIAPLIGWTADSLDRLAMARERKSRLLVLQGRPPVAQGDDVPAALMLSATDRAQAQARLAELLTQAAGRTAATIENISPEALDSPPSREVHAVISVTGTESAVVGFLADVEGGSPLVRFKAWKLARNDSAPGTVKFEAVAAALWAKP